MKAFRDGFGRGARREHLYRYNISPQSLPDVLPDMLVALARLVFEIRDLMADEGEEGQVALACAIFNRMRRYGPDGEGSGGAVMAAPPAGLPDPAFCRAFAVACLVLSGDMDDPTNGATHFHRHSDNPDWALGLRPKALIGQHFFYALND